MNDQELRDLFHAYRPEIGDDDEFIDRLTAQMDAEDARQAQSRIMPLHRRILVWAAGIAACATILLGGVHLKRAHFAHETKDIAQVEPSRDSKERPTQMAKTEGVPTEQQDDAAQTMEKGKKPLIGHSKPMVAQQVAPNQPVKAKEHHQAETKTKATAPATTDSLDYYIDKIERELAQVSDSLYIERMNQVIQADERLQRIVNQYIIQRITEDDRPQSVQISDF